MLAEPLLRAMALEAYPPPDTTTDPVGVGFPVPPLTTMVRVSDWEVVMLAAEGVTATVGVIFDGVVTATVADPPEPL